MHIPVKQNLDQKLVSLSDKILYRIYFTCLIWLLKQIHVTLPWFYHKIYLLTPFFSIARYMLEELKLYSFQLKEKKQDIKHLEIWIATPDYLTFLAQTFFRDWSFNLNLNYKWDSNYCVLFMICFLINNELEW